MKNLKELKKTKTEKKVNCCGIDVKLIVIILGLVFISAFASWFITKLYYSKEISSRDKQIESFDEKLINILRNK